LTFFPLQSMLNFAPQDLDPVYTLAFICACFNLYITMTIYAMYNSISKTGSQENDFLTFSPFSRKISQLTY